MWQWRSIRGGAQVVQGLDRSTKRPSHLISFGADQSKPVDLCLCRVEGIEGFAKSNRHVAV